MRKTLRKILTDELNYTMQEADTAIVELTSLAPPLDSLLAIWMKDRTENDFSVDDYSARGFTQMGYEYPEALIALASLLPGAP